MNQKAELAFITLVAKNIMTTPSVKHTYDVAGKLSQKYISDTIHDWEMIGMVPMKFNRMVLYNPAHYIVLM